MEAKTICVTGATGFIGKKLVEILIKTDFSVRALVRSDNTKLPAKVECHVIKGLNDESPLELKDGLQGVKVVIHLAGRAHIMDDRASDPLAEFRKVNIEGTLNLARLAADSGVRRFIFLSSVKVNGESTPQGRQFFADDTPAPEDPYGVSKSEAEMGLLEIAKESSMEIVIIRPPLVYGPGVKGNFASLIKWVERGIPLPLGAVHNLRSLVALDNLVDFISLCIRHPAAANQVFLVSDGNDISTSDLLKKIASAFDRRARLIPVPVGLMAFAATILGKEAVADRLFGSLRVDITKARDLLGWQPVVSMDDQLKKMVEKR
jgi:nucleoside-diphosphate-sugar epimerase